MNMNPITLVTYTLLFATDAALSSPITFELQKGQRECYYTLTPDTECSVSYYFAVQEGEENDFQVNYEIFGPADKYNPILERSKERQGEWSFYAEHKGEYAFCFYGGQEHDKIVDLEIKYDCNRQEDARSQKRKARKEQRRLRDTRSDPLQNSLENSVENIERQLYLLERNMQYYKTRNNRNHYTVRSTNRRIVMFSIYGILLVIGMSCAQVVMLQWFFKVSRKHAV